MYFIDEAQRFTLKDIGSIGLIRKFADKLGVDVYESQLSSQFRCDGSDGYIAWLNDVLGIRETANNNNLGMDYDIQIVDSPNVLRQMIKEKMPLPIKHVSSRLLLGMVERRQEPY